MKQKWLDSGIWNGYMNIRQHTFQDIGIKRDKERHFIRTKGSIYQEGIIINMDVPDKRRTGWSEIFQLRC